LAKRVRVVIIQEALRRYRVPFFEQLRSVLNERDIDLEFVHGFIDPGSAWGDEAQLPWARTMPTRWRYWRRRGTRIVWHPIVPYVRGADLVIVEQRAGLVPNYPLLLAQHLGGPKIALWGHGRSYGNHGGGAMQGAARRWMTRRPAWWFTYTEEGADTIAELGFPRERITVVRNSTDTRSLTRRVEAVTEDQLGVARARYGVTSSNVALFIGSMWRKRRTDFLLGAADSIRAQVPDFELLVVGGGSRAAHVERAAQQREWMRYVGPQFDEDLARLLRLARLILAPGPVGLIAVDSFAAGVPLVASSSAEPLPEYAYIEHGVNGEVVDDGGDPRIYADAVARLLHDEDRRRILVRGCVEARRRFSVEQMVDRFAGGIDRALSV
jgi:glycosyltransferase involved in cell wall biosynthesis